MRMMLQDGRERAAAEYSGVVDLEILSHTILAVAQDVQLAQRRMRAHAIVGDGVPTRGWA